MILCTRCKLEKPAVTNTAFYTGEVGKALKEHACEDCWKDWIKMQIMIVNEYRLNLMDPKTDEFLNAQVMAFFNLDPSASVAKVDYVPPKDGTAA
jgi:Fe-S cluster biosynthesis and repair protein YggX